MYLLLRLTNGDGYAFPIVKLFHSQLEAKKEYLELISSLVLEPDTCSDDSMDSMSIEGSFKSLFVSLDEDGRAVDNFGVYLMPIESGDCIEFYGDYVDEVSIKKEKSKVEFDSDFLLTEEEEDGSITFKVYIK